jgi:hypothetical protein
VTDNETPQDTPASTGESSQVIEPTADAEAGAGEQRGATDIEGLAAEQTRDEEHERGEGSSQVVQPVFSWGKPQANPARNYEGNRGFSQLLINQPGARKVDQTSTLSPTEPITSKAG